MINLNDYVSEKLHLNKEIQRNTFPEIEDEDELYIHKMMNKNDVQQAREASKFKDKNKVIRKYIAGLKMSNSSLPLLINDKIYSQPLNMFCAYGNRALQLGWTIDEIQEMYNISKNIDVNDYLNKQSLLSIVCLCNVVPGITTDSRGIPKVDDKDVIRYNDEWTEDFKNKVSTMGEFKNPHSYIVKFKNKEHIIEYITQKTLYSYYGFWIDGKKCVSYDDFREQLIRL